MNIGLFILCVFLSYLFSYFFSCFNILAFNSAILLLHKAFGPELIFRWFYVLSGYSYKVLLCMTAHYLWTSFLIFLIFVYSLLKCVRRTCNNPELSQLEKLREDIADLNRKVDQVDSRLDDVLAILERMERSREGIKTKSCDHAFITTAILEGE